MLNCQCLQSNGTCYNRKTFTGGVLMPELIEVKIDSLRVSLTNQQRIVILKQVDADRYLPIWIGPYEAESITIALQEIEVSRPQTHDLVKNTIALLGGNVERVIINDIKSDIFYGLIIINRDGKSLELDSRPSDAIAIAVRTHVPIFVTPAVMDTAAILPEEEVDEERMEEPSGKEPSVKKTKISSEDRLSVFEDYLKKRMKDEDQKKDEDEQDNEDSLPAKS